ncbi:hypothetical protein KDM41_12465 [bacterium]|nr:hypothetical protein [bacterium]
MITFVAALLLAGGAVARAAPDARTWRWDLSAGADASLFTYALATTDTTETLSEFLLQAGLTGASSARGKHRWRVRLEASGGTELYRERIEGDYRLLDADKVERVRLAGRWWGRQYRESTTYSRSSDNGEGRLDAVATPLAGTDARLQVRGWTGRIDYATPSALEVDRRDLGAGLAVRASAGAGTQWGIDGRVGRSSYPDSAQIDRDTWSIATDFDSQTLDRSGLRLYHKSERREVRDESVRPSAWTHWIDASLASAAGAGHVLLAGQLESWQYDTEDEVYFDSNRLAGFAGYRWGDILGTQWQIGLAGERLAAGDSPETYSQYGLRGGVEAWGGDVSGTLTLEVGRRRYDDGDVVLSDDAADPLATTTTLYTDFTYWQLWLMATWRLSPAWDVDVLANYEPESHTEAADDVTLGYGSLRVRWRP